MELLLNEREINVAINAGRKNLSGFNTGEISDGYHTFEELYDHRIILYIGFAKFCVLKCDITVWRSEKQADETSFDGWFLLGIEDRPGAQISYHLPMKFWDLCNFADTLETAPVFDGHTSKDVLERLEHLIVLAF